MAGFGGQVSKEAKEVWVRFYNEHADEQVEMKGDLAAAWSKLEGYAARFALLIHLIRSVSDDPNLVTASSIVGLAPRMIPRSRADNPPDYLQELEQVRCHLVRRILLSNPYPRCSCKIGISAS